MIRIRFIRLIRNALPMIAILLLLACVLEGEIKLPLNMTPRDIGDGWPLASPEDVGLRYESVYAAFEQLFDVDRFPTALSFLVVRDGRLVAEGYLRDLADISRREHVQSVTKSLTSIAFGIARENGFFPDLNAPLADFVSVSNPEKRTITIEHLLTMRSGIDLDNTRFALELLIPEQTEMTEWLLDQPLGAKPGEVFEYRDCDPQLLGSAILAATGQSVEELLRAQLFEPLGIVDIAWEHNADDEPLAAHGVWLRARDLAKLGEVIRAGGIWQGTTLLDGAWLADATQPHTDAGVEHTNDGIAYGYYFWIDESAGAYSALGHGGTFVYVRPDARLLMVITAMPYSSGAIWPSWPEIADLADLILDGSSP